MADLAANSATLYELASLEHSVASKVDAIEKLLRRGTIAAEKSVSAQTTGLVASPKTIQPGTVVESKAPVRVPKGMLMLVTATSVGWLTSGKRVIVPFPEHRGLLSVIADATGAGPEGYPTNWWLVDPLADGAIIDITESSDLLRYFGDRDALLELHALSPPRDAGGVD